MLTIAADNDSAQQSSHGSESLKRSPSGSQRDKAVAARRLCGSSRGARSERVPRGDATCITEDLAKLEAFWNEEVAEGIRNLLRPILLFVAEKQSLRDLCLVSRHFVSEAQPRLYSDVAVRSSAVTSFCHTIISSPFLAKRVQRLSIQLSSLDASTDLDVDLLSAALHSLPNVRALEITPPQPTHWAQAEHRHGLWSAAHILRHCPFRLTKFVSAFHVAHADYMAFLGEQPDIEELVSLDMTTRGSHPEPKPAHLPALRLFRTAMVRLEF
ncbi:hypothetical protein GGX14DRAFT_547045, partial [Mycena pura]